MSDPTCIINGHQVTWACLHVKRSGPWWLDAEMSDESEGLEAGPVKIEMLGGNLQGTLTRGGEFGLQKRLRIVGGKGAWSRALPGAPYHSDSGVKAKTVAADAAAACGETLGGFAPLATTMGSDYVRMAGLTASATLEQAAGGKRWWVDYAGVTQVGERPAVQPVAGSYTVLTFDPRTCVAEVAVDTLSAVGIGTVLTERLKAPVTVAGFDLELADSGARLWAWCPPTADAPQASDPADLLEALVMGIMSRSRFGRYRCRVTSQAGKRCNLEATNARDGLPDLSLVAMAPGVAGTEATLKANAEVWVEFEAGDVRRPLISGFAPGQVKVLTLGNGSSSGVEAAGKGDTVSCVFPPTPFTATAIIGGVPTPLQGVMTPLAPELQGSITNGRASVKLRDG